MRQTLQRAGPPAALRGYLALKAPFYRFTGLSLSRRQRGSNPVGDTQIMWL